MKRLLILIGFLVLVVAGCGVKVGSNQDPSPETPTKRFRVVYSQSAPYVNVIQDIETGVCWVYRGDGYGGGLAEAPKEVCEVTRR